MVFIDFYTDLIDDPKFSERTRHPTLLYLVSVRENHTHYLLRFQNRILNPIWIHISQIAAKTNNWSKPLVSSVQPVQNAATLNPTLWVLTNYPNVPCNMPQNIFVTYAGEINSALFHRWDPKRSTPQWQTGRQDTSIVAYLRTIFSSIQFKNQQKELKWLLVVSALSMSWGRIERRPSFECTWVNIFVPALTIGNSHFFWII